MSDALSADPDRFSTSWRPALVEKPDTVDPEFVADAQIVDQGWLRVRTWADAVRYYPPQRVRALERVAVETYTPEGEPTCEVGRIADADLRERARQLTGQPTTDADRAVIADD